MLDERAKNSDRLAAAAWLGDRGFGKAIGMDVLVRVDAAKSSGALPTLDTAVLEMLVAGGLDNGTKYKDDGRSMVPSTGISTGSGPYVDSEVKAANQIVEPDP